MIISCAIPRKRSLSGRLTASALVNPGTATRAGAYRPLPRVNGKAPGGTGAFPEPGYQGSVSTVVERVLRSRRKLVPPKTRHSFSRNSVAARRPTVCFQHSGGALPSNVLMVSRKTHSVYGVIGGMFSPVMLNREGKFSLSLSSRKRQMNMHFAVATT